jgi:predicted GIY-YIG superfamily endonuclease
MNEQRHHWWQGKSGHWYVHTVFDRLPAGLSEANYVLVRRNADGTCTSLYIGETGELARRWMEHERSGLVSGATRLGLNELHVHLLASDDRERVRVETDLRHGHDPPLNRQPVPTSRIGFGFALAPLMTNALLGYG